MSARRKDPCLPNDGVLRQTCPDCKGQHFAIMQQHVIMCGDCGTTLVIDWMGALG